MSAQALTRLAFYPPVGIIFKRLDHDLEIDGQWFQKGCLFMLLGHSNPDVWPDPEL